LELTTADGLSSARSVPGGTTAARRHRYGSDLGVALDAVTSGALRHRLPLKLALEVHCPPEGRPSDLLRGAPLPLLDLPFALLDDLGVPNGAERDAVERGLFRAAFFHATAVLVGELLLGAESEFTADTTVMLPGLVQEGDWELAGVSGDVERLWQWSVPFWERHERSLGQFHDHCVGRSDCDPELAAELLAGRWAPLEAHMVAAALFAGRAELLPLLVPLLDEAVALFQLGRDAGNASRDLARGHFTLPLLRVAVRAGLARPEPPPSNPMLAAMMFTGAVPELVQEALGRCARLRRQVDDLGLAHLGGTLARLDAPFRTIDHLYGGRAGSAPPEPEAPEDRWGDPDTPGFVWVLSPHPNLLQTLDAAEEYLLSDVLLRESWDVRRLDDGRVRTGRLLPSAWILDSLAAAGADVAAWTEQVMADAARHGLRYFDEQADPRCDAALLGALRRLLERVPDAALLRPTLEAALAATPDGAEVPPCATGYDLLLGLLELPSAAGLVARELPRALDGYGAPGAPAPSPHDLLHDAWRMLELAAAVEGADAWRELADAARAAGERAGARVRAHRNRGWISHGDAALLTLASRHPRVGMAVDPCWVDLLLRTQRTDGAWDECPLGAVPWPGSLASGYASRGVTTALCLRALAQHAGRRG